MSCFRIFYVDGQKMCQPVTSREQYLALRNDARHINNLALARSGNKDAKRRLMQFNYSCLPSGDMRLKGCQQMSHTVGMDVDFSADSLTDSPLGITPEAAELLGDKVCLQDVISKVIALKDELGLVLLERSVSKGFHMVFRRRPDLSQEDNLRWASDLIGCDYDKCAKDITRVFFASSASEDDLLFLDDTLFDNSIPTYEGVTESKYEAAKPAKSRTNAVNASSVTNAATDQSSVASSGGSSDAAAASSLISRLEREMGGAPEEGCRNNFVFRMACRLRHILGPNATAIRAVLPAYGLSDDEVRQCIDSALSYSDTDSPGVASAQRKGSGEPTVEFAPCPAMPDKLPPLIDLLVSRTPDVYRPAVANAVFPALGAHLWNTRFKYIDNVEHEATLMCVLMAGTGAGKSCITEPIRHIMADIVERDEINRQKEKLWKDEVNLKGANKDKKKRPEGIVIQCVKPDMTNAAFVQRMKEAEGRFLYSQMNEIEQFDALKTSSRSKSHFQIMCLAFDPGNSYGTERVGTMSVSETVSIRFNWNASTTINKGRQYFSSVLTDGPVSRINFCTIPEREIGADMPVYGSYGDDFAAQLKPYIERLNAARGLVVCPEAMMLAKALKEENADFARLSQNRVYENLSFRANVIAYLKAMVLYVASGEVWTPEMEDFIRWSEQYDLWCKMRFFGDAIAEADERGERRNGPGPRNLLEMLPDVFTREELETVRKRMGVDKGPVKTLVGNWKHRGYIEITDDGKLRNLYFSARDKQGISKG